MCFCVCVCVFPHPPLTSLICVAPPYFDQRSHTGAHRSKGKRNFTHTDEVREREKKIEIKKHIFRTVQPEHIPEFDRLW